MFLNNYLNSSVIFHISQKLIKKQKTHIIYFKDIIFKHKSNLRSSVGMLEILDNNFKLFANGYVFNFYV